MVTLRETGELAGVAAFARNDLGGLAGTLRAGTCSGWAPAPGEHLLQAGTCSRLAPAPGGHLLPAGTCSRRAPAPGWHLRPARRGPARGCAARGDGIRETSRPCCTPPLCGRRGPRGTALEAMSIQMVQTANLSEQRRHRPHAVSIDFTESV